MRFVVRMAVRELRSGWRQLALFFVCISVGVASIVTLRSFIESIDRYVAGEARSINGADIVLESQREWSDEARAAIDRIAVAPAVVERTQTIATQTMLRPREQSTTARMVELEGVEPGYPIYGAVGLTGGAPYSYDLLRGGGILLGAATASQLGLGPGEFVRIGSRDFEVRGTVEKLPGQVNAFTFGQRALVSLDDLRAAGLLDFGSRARRKILLRVADEHQQATLEVLRAELKRQLVTVRGYREAQEGLSESLGRSGDYLSLAGLAVLVLGGVGIWSVTRVFVRQRLKSIAVLKCLGCSNRQAIGAYTAQSLAMGLAGSILGVALSALLLAFIGSVFLTGPLAAVPIGMTPRAVGQGIAVGVLVALLFSLTPLLGIRAIKVNLVLRSTGDLPSIRWDRWTVLAAVATAAGLFGVAAWQAGSPRVGLFFLGGLVAAFLVLGVLAEALVRSLRLLGRFSSFRVRYALGGLGRPGNQTRAVIVTIGLGVFFLSAAYGVQSSVIRELDRQTMVDAPDMYLVDVQPDQRDDVARIVREVSGQEPLLIPTARARVTALDGVEVELNRPPDRRGRPQPSREYTVTAKGELDEHEELLAGEWWREPSPPGAPAEVSVEESMSLAFGLRVGGTMTFDIQGRQLTARIASVRRVDWPNARVGFMIVFRPGSLDDFSLMSIGAFRGPKEPAARGLLARTLADAHPNVSLIDALEILSTVQRILSAINVAITVVGAFVLAAGLAILAGSIAVTRYLRLYEAAVLKTLGATSREVLGIAALEFSLLGAVAGVAGSALAVGLAWAVCTRVLELTWRFDPALTLGGMVATAVAVAVIGALSTAGVVFQKPLAVLRGE